MRYPEERAKVVAAGREMLQRGFTEGTSGNVSMRVDDGALITPSSVPYLDITDEDVVLMDLDGNILEGERSRLSSTRCISSATSAGPTSVP